MRETLGDDVITSIKALPDNCIFVWANSNNPTNHGGATWGCYVGYKFKISTGNHYVFVINYGLEDTSIYFASFGLSSINTIPWKKATLTNYSD